ncbi:Protein CBG09694 [Caenorhabditis briggsae]|uniref:Protein CBG09694 n=1 Tax=Caenorhabditis briggsae TaxID=6238 RepID=A8X8H2_CAEBR|nr:Protein CBG09694 [Caenorhabditis briggsae]CAP28933.2 Protein CBG09694 [Caenorhabditis briggsae]
MLKTFIILFILSQLAFGGYQDNTGNLHVECLNSPPPHPILSEFDEKIKEIIRTRANGDVSFLRRFVNADGIPQGLGNRDGFNDSYCYNITERLLAHSKYADCTKLQSLNGSVVDLNLWTGFDIFKFSVNLLELKNVDVEMTYRTELTYLYFSAFRKCDSRQLFFEIRLTENNFRLSIQFYEKSRSDRPKLLVRGNLRLKLSQGADRRKIEDLKKVCNKEMCEIQKNEECHFRHSIKNSDEYSNCRHVYGDMYFNSRFQESQPGTMDFRIDGCFVFNRTGIQFLRPIMRAFSNCSRSHLFFKNKYMCTDQLLELKDRWKSNNVNVTPADGMDVKCYQGECRGGFVSENVKDRYSGCEVIRGNVLVTEQSGNVSERVRDLSYAHVINGSLHLINNTSLKKLTLPFLKEIYSTQCPALVIQNMSNLTDIIFHSHIEFNCNSTGPKVLIRNSPKLYLYHQTLEQMRKAGAILDDFNSETDTYSENSTFYLVGLCVLIVIFVEIAWALRKNLLFPNWIYRIFPMSIKRKLKQKQPRKKKEE